MIQKYARLLIGAGIIILLIAVGLGVRSCVRGNYEEVREKVEDAQSGAAINSARDAINTQAGANEREKQSEEISRENEGEIRNAQGANDAVDPAVRDAGLRAACRRAAYRNTERCRVFRAGAGRVDGGS